jgi:hypothetical protein
MGIIIRVMLLSYSTTDENWELPVYVSFPALLLGELSPFRETVPGFQDS